MRRFPGLLVAVLVLLASAPPRRARAAGPSAADALVDKAVALRRDGDDQGALALLLQAYGMGQEPRATGQLGLCEQALGRWVDAEAYLTDALKATHDPWVKKNRRTLEDALAIVKSHVARLEISGEPEGADVWVNGTNVGKLPLAAPVRVAEGEVEVELRMEGYVRQTKTMRLEPGQYQRVFLRAHKDEPEPPPVAAAPAAPLPPPPVVVAPAPSPAPVVANVEDKHHDDFPAATRQRLALKWIAWGVGAAAVGLGVYGAVSNHVDRSDFDSHPCGITLDGIAVNQNTGKHDPACDDLKSAYETGTTIAVGGFIAAGVLAATGFVLWLTEPSARTPQTAGLECLPALTERGGPAAGCTLRF
ncbi:MAG TPA: PEGA domain-containing protein [Polyangia bacterium]|nr:PEGA domain-containing protein [Polyangia bacterium]